MFNALVVGVRSQAVASSKAAREDRRMCVRSDGGRGGLRELEPEGDHNSYSNSGINCAASSGTMECMLLAKAIYLCDNNNPLISLVIIHFELKRLNSQHCARIWITVEL